MSISRRDLLSLPLVGALSTQPAHAEDASAESAAEKKPEPKTVEELLAAYADLLKRLTLIEQGHSHLSRTNPPVGTVVAFAGQWLPKRVKGPVWTEVELGWLLCNGRNWDVVQKSLQKELDELHIDAHADQLLLELRAVLGNDSLPDYQGRVLVGAGQGKGLSARNLGDPPDGWETHTLTIPEMPTHNHTVTDRGHEHLIKWGAKIAPGTSSYERSAQVGNELESVTPHTRLAQTGIKIDNSGSNSPHNNMQPFRVANFIIKFK